MTAAEADDSDIGSGSDHLPAVAAAGVLLFKLHDIARLYFHNHDKAL